jgi:hypothetical protein
MLTTFPASAPEMNLHTHKGKSDTLNHDGETSGVKLQLNVGNNEVRNPSFFCFSPNKMLLLPVAWERRGMGKK